MSSCAPINSKADMADMLERFFDRIPAGEHATGWEWDDFERGPFKDESLEAWRQKVLREVGHLVAPTPGDYEKKLADDRINRIITALRNGQNA